MNIELKEKSNPEAKEDENLHSEADLVEADTSKILAQGIDEDPDKELKKNLMFAQKDIGAFQLLCHLSEKIEQIMMILGVIGSIGSGIAGPLMSLLFG